MSGSSVLSGTIYKQVATSTNESHLNHSSILLHFFIAIHSFLSLPKTTGMHYDH